MISESASAARDLLGAQAVDLAFVDVAAPQPHEVVTAARDRAPVVVLSTGGDSKVMLDFVCELEVEHFLARSDDGEESFDALAREVVVTAEKLLRRDLFGIEKYLPSFGMELTTFEVKSAQERDDVVECVADHVTWLGAGSETRRAVAAVVDELVTNAIYDAPRTIEGQARYAARDRKEKFTLDPWEHVHVRWGSSGDHIAISVSDSFGALRPEHVRACLRRCLTDEGDQIEQKAGGAGLGLYTALSYCTQLIVNIEHGTRTELIALVDLRRGQAVRRGGRSLHLFCDDPRTRVAETDAVPAKVEISPSMLTELREQLAPMRRQATVVPLTRRRAPSLALGSAPAIRARGTESPPIMDDTVDASTAIGLLHGVTDSERAVQTALRFLANHYTGAVAYAVDDGRLDAALCAGRVRDWPMLQKLHLLSDGPCSIVSLASEARAHVFEPQSPLDYRVALWTAGVSEAQGIVVPIRVAGNLRWILYAAGPLPDVSVTPQALVQVHRELESSLLRLDVDEPEIEVRWG
ncbi:MAG TPA: ATP-binding protein [Kofleriaceae bacterium]|nr:ATP-binding protein [Kofleriaceae bacterium]